ncbi:MAG: hypothetical protein IJ191_00870 [Treponema sp.]|nr:hypothetical protein [Treponema sp.]
MNIITETDIDETAAKDYLTVPYGNLDLLPCVPVELSVTDAAHILAVSRPTVDRMLTDGQIALTKASLINYIQSNLKAERPLTLTPKTAPDSPK